MIILNTSVNCNFLFWIILRPFVFLCMVAFNLHEIISILACDHNWDSRKHSVNKLKTDRTHTYYCITSYLSYKAYAILKHQSLVHDYCFNVV